MSIELVDSVAEVEALLIRAQRYTKGCPFLVWDPL